MADLQDDLQDLHTVLEMCGIVENPAISTLFLNLEGFNTLSDLGDLLEDDNDVTAMAGLTSRRTVAEGRIILGTKVSKRVQTLVIWWICDQKKQNLHVVAADFNADMIGETATLKLLRSEPAHKEPPVTALAKVHPDDFDTHEDAFLDLLAQSFGVIRRTLTLHCMFGHGGDYLPLLLTKNKECTGFPLDGNTKQSTASSKRQGLRTFPVRRPTAMSAVPISLNMMLLRTTTLLTLARN
jgi:hypothetical protein